MNLFGYMIDNTQLDIEKREPLIGDIHAVYNKDSKELLLKSRSGRFSAIEILEDMFGKKNVSGDKHAAVAVNREEIHFALLNSRLRETID